MKTPNSHFPDQFPRPGSQIVQISDQHTEISPFQRLSATTQSNQYTPTSHFTKPETIHIRQLLYSFKSKTEKVLKLRSKPPKKKTLQKECVTRNDRNKKHTFHVPVNPRQRVKNQDQPDQHRRPDISPDNKHLFKLKSTHPLHECSQIHTKFRQKKHHESPKTKL